MTKDSKEMLSDTLIVTGNNIVPAEEIKIVVGNKLSKTGQKSLSNEVKKEKASVKAQKTDAGKNKQKRVSTKKNLNRMNTKDEIRYNTRLVLRELKKMNVTKESFAKRFILEMFWSKPKSDLVVKESSIAKLLISDQIDTLWNHFLAIHKKELKKIGSKKIKPVAAERELNRLRDARRRALTYFEAEHRLAEKQKKEAA